MQQCTQPSTDIFSKSVDLTKCLLEECDILVLANYLVSARLACHTCMPLVGKSKVLAILLMLVLGMHIG